MPIPVSITSIIHLFSFCMFLSLLNLLALYILSYYLVKLLFVVSVFIELLLICIFLKSNDVFKIAESKYKGR